MPSMNHASMNHTVDVLQVTFAEIDEEGNVTKRFPRIDAEGQLKNTVLHRRYPEILVAVLSVPKLQLDAYEEAASGSFSAPLPRAGERSRS